MIRHTHTPTHLHQQRHESALVDLQNLSVLGAQQDVAVTQRDGSDGRVVLQQETCRPPAQPPGGGVGPNPESVCYLTY